MSQEMLQIRQQLINQDWTSLQRTIHNIKGVSANLCIQPMYEISAAIDLKLKAENRACIDNDINELNDIFDATASEIQSILEMKSLKA